jgi:putative aldouronate transport system substrate-binding protein
VYRWAKYEYQLPLSTSDEVFTHWTTPIIADEIPETGAGDMPYFAALREMTGVNIEYLMIAWAERATNFSVLLASDDLPDLITNANLYYTGPLQEAVDEGYYANLYDYKDYMPNYYLSAYAHPEDINVLATIMPYPETIFCFYCEYGEWQTRDCLAARGDWLEELGMTNEDIVTMDDLTNMLTLFKTEIEGCDYPFLMFNTLDPHNCFTAYDTLCHCNIATVAPQYILDGQVQFGNSGPNDLKFMTMVNDWWNAGLFQPDWLTSDGTGTPAIREMLSTGVMGVMGCIPSEAADFGGGNNSDPDAYFVPIRKPVLTEGQTFHLGDVRSWFSLGAWAISAKCANIPLLVTYCDWFYSDEGVFFSKWGVEGHSFEYNENGEPQLTEFMYKHPYGLATALIQHTLNEVCEGGLMYASRSYAFPGGEQLAAFSTFWDDPDHYTYDASMQWPSAIALSPEDNATIAQLGADIKTYIAENYLQFVDNSKPLSEWDSYVASLPALGWEEARTIYQNAYDDFMERFGS